MRSYQVAFVACLICTISTSSFAGRPLLTKAAIASENYCEQKYLGVHGDGAEVESQFEAVSPEVRGSILDCETQYDAHHRPPTDAEITAETRRQHAAEDAHWADTTIPKEPDSRVIQTVVAAAHRALLAAVKDPSSTLFNPQDGTTYSFNNDGSLYAVCGGINSKNGFGGYVGEQIWIYVIPKKHSVHT